MKNNSSVSVAWSMPHSLFAVFTMKLHMYVWKKFICGSEYVGLDILGQSNEDKTVSQKTDWCIAQASANIWSIFECRSNSVCTINKLNPLFGSDDIVRCLCIIFFSCFHLIFQIVVIFIVPHCQNTQSIDLSHSDWHVHACMKNKQRDSASFYVCCHCRENGIFCHVILIVIDGLDI